jgi:predicted DNA-binding transcriptional regulator AlpA
MPVHQPKTFHIDKRAAAIADAGAGDDDELLSPIQVADWLGVSHQWLAHRRDAGDGPPFERITPHIIRYRRDKVRAWLDARSYRSTREYRKAEAGAVA